MDKGLKVNHLATVKANSLV